MQPNSRMSNMAKKVPCTLCPKTLPSPSHLKIHMCRCIVERNPMSVMNVGRHLVKHGIWRLTSDFILGRNLTSVNTVTMHLLKLDIWRHTSGFTQGRSHINVHTVIMHVVIAVLWRVTWRLTLERSPLSAFFVTTHQFIHSTLGNTCWPTLT